MIEMQEFAELLKQNHKGIQKIEDIFALVPFHEVEWRDYFAVLAKGIKTPNAIAVPAWLWDLRDIIQYVTDLSDDDFSQGLNVPVEMIQAIRNNTAIGKNRYHKLACYEETKARFKDWYVNRILTDHAILINYAELAKRILDTENKTAETIHEIYVKAELLSEFAQKVDYNATPKDWY